MNGLKRAIDLLETLSLRVGQAVSWLTLAMVLVTFAIVVLRYGFGLNWIWLQESVVYLHALVFMAGIAYTLRENSHVRVDIFYQRLSPRGKAWVELLGGLFLLLPMTLFLAWVSWDYVAASWALKESSREAGGLPFVYVMKAYIPLMCALLLLQGLAGIGRAVLVLAGEPVPLFAENIGEEEL